MIIVQFLYENHAIYEPMRITQTTDSNEMWPK